MIRREYHDPEIAILTTHIIVHLGSSVEEGVSRRAVLVETVVGNASIDEQDVRSTHNVAGCQQMDGLLYVPTEHDV